MVCLHNSTTSMGLKLKPRKCRSISIRSGKSEEIIFSLGDSQIASILHDRYHKFLGGFDFSTASAASVIQERVSEQIENIDRLLVRDELKMRIYSDYVLGSLCFLFSVHGPSVCQKTDILTFSPLLSAISSFSSSVSSICMKYPEWFRVQSISNIV